MLAVLYLVTTLLVLLFSLSFFFLVHLHSATFLCRSHEFLSVRIVFVCCLQDSLLTEYPQA